jgi:RNA polymerase sigma factor (sigma-70 family)
MRFTVAKSELRIDQGTQMAIDRHRAKIEALCSDFETDSTELRLRFQDLPGKKQVHVTGVLEIPGTALRAEYAGRAPEPAAIEMFRRLERELKRYKAQRREQERVSPREQFQGTLHRSGASNVVKEQFISFLEENLSRFYNYAYREVRSRVYQGFVRPGDIRVRDVLDEAIAEVLENLQDRFDDQEATQLIYRTISRVVVRESNQRRLPQSHLEELLESQDIDTELHEYYQPDDVDWLEEVVPDVHAVQPDQQYELTDLERRVEKLVSELPRQWREAFILTAQEGLSEEEAAMVQQRPIAELREDVEQARSFLRERLSELGITGAEV